MNLFIDNNKTKMILAMTNRSKQRVKWMEEPAELIQAIAKDDVENIKEEVADVLHICHQIIKAYEIPIMDINKLIEYKQIRTIKMLKDNGALPPIKKCRKCKSEARLLMIPGSAEYQYIVECTRCNKRSDLHDTELETVEEWNHDAQ